jgi:hypothetical protein
MGIPVDIDVAKYKASQMEGNRLKKVRDDAKVTANPVLELTPEAKKASKEEIKVMRQAEREVRNAADANKQAATEKKTVTEKKTAVVSEPTKKTEQPASTAAVASEMAK